MNRMKLEDITLNHLKILKVVDECHSFSIAAKKLGYSQALISKKVKQLEDYFGVRLLNRCPGSVSLTHKGKALISQTYNVVETVENLQQEFQINLSFEGEEIVIGVPSLLSATWLQEYLQRFYLCFPGSLLREEIISSQQSFSNSDLSHIDLLLTSNSAYKEDHHCTRLETYSFVLLSFNSYSAPDLTDSISIHQVDFSEIVLLEEIYQELKKNQSLNIEKLDEALVLKSYQETIDVAYKHQKLTILPDFCQKYLEKNYNIQVFSIPDIHEYGIYIHVPKFSEPLVVAESLVRSFRLNQEEQDCLPHTERSSNIPVITECEVLRIGVQQDSIGQLIASYGVKYVSDLLGSPSYNQSHLKGLDIDRQFDLQISLCSSGIAMNRAMKRGELDICLFDDTALLSNGSYFFHDFSFGSKLIGIASYNLLGRDISIVIHKHASIESIEDLRGKRISTWFGSNAHRFLITLLDRYGIDINSDCTLVDEDPWTASSSLLHQRIDAYVCCETFADWLEESAFTKRLSQEQAFDIQIPSLRGIVCRSQFLKENPKTVMAYLHDLIVANHWFLSNSMRAVNLLSQFTNIGTAQVLQFFDPTFGTRIDPTLKPQWSWLLKTLNRRLEGKYGISKFDVDFWIDDYLLRLVYSLLELDYHFHQISFSNNSSSSYFLEEKFTKYLEALHPKLAS